MTLKAFLLAVFLIAAGAFVYAQVTARAEPKPEPKPQSGTVEVATFAAGCFWGVQDKFDHLKGVLRTIAGYTGGTLKNPTYEEVCSKTTGHAESVEVEFDPKVVSYAELVDFFWKIHNPSELNRQGPDIGNNYRTAIFYHTPGQKAVAEAAKATLNATDRYHGSIVTEIAPAGPFYPAEGYHQHYLQKNGGFCGVGG